MEAETVRVKRYPNRRMYDTSAGRYVNLADVAAMLRKGANVQVVDAKTGEDLTRVVLTQIIVEDAKGQPTGLPLELLRQMVVASDRAGREFLMWYLQSAFDAYQKVQESVQSRLNEVRSAALSPISLMKNLLGGAPQGGSEELQQLRSRVAELEARVGKAQPARKRGARRAPKTGKL